MFLMVFFLFFSLFSSSFFYFIFFGGTFANRSELTTNPAQGRKSRLLDLIDSLHGGKLHVGLLAIYELDDSRHLIAGDWRCAAILFQEVAHAANGTDRLCTKRRVDLLAQVANVHLNYV